MHKTLFCTLGISFSLFLISCGKELPAVSTMNNLDNLESDAHYWPGGDENLPATAGSESSGQEENRMSPSLTVLPEQLRNQNWVSVAPNGITRITSSRAGTARP